MNIDASKHIARKVCFISVHLYICSETLETFTTTPVCDQPLPLAVSRTLPAFAAERWRILLINIYSNQPTNLLEGH